MFGNSVLDRDFDCDSDHQRFVGPVTLSPTAREQMVPRSAFS